MNIQKEITSDDETRTWLSPEELDYFRNLLIIKRSEAEKEIDLIRESMADRADSDAADHSSFAHHSGDVGTDVENTNMNYKLIEREKKFIEQIDDALARIDNGTYGICQATGEPISRGRLKAVPHTRYSIRAKKLGLAGES